MDTTVEFDDEFCLCGAPMASDGACENDQHYEDGALENDEDAGADPNAS